MFCHYDKWSDKGNTREMKLFKPGGNIKPFGYRSMSHLIVKSQSEFQMENIGKFSSVPHFVMQRFLEKERRDLIAMVDGNTNEKITYAEMYRRTTSFAFSLQKYLCITTAAQRPCIAIMSPNHLNYLNVFLGASLGGALTTTINPSNSVEETVHQVSLTESKLLLYHQNCAPIATQVADKCGIPALSLDPSAESSVVPMLQETKIDLSHFPEENNFDDDSVFTIPFSSGTTGRSKGVVLSHRNITTNIRQTIAMEGKYALPEYTRSGSLGVMCCPLPFFHIYGLLVGMLMPAQLGVPCVFTSAFDLELFLSIIQQYRVTRAYIVPPIAIGLAKHPLVEKYDLSSLETLMSGAAPMGAGLPAAVSRRLRCIVKQAWGMTETSPAASITPDSYYRPNGFNTPDADVVSAVEKTSGTSGCLVPETEAQLVDTNSGKTVDPYTEEGELWVRGPQVMKGYLNDPKATSGALTCDGWLRTGDIATFSPDGLVTITGRCKELIKYKGFQVPPAELESILLSHNSIADAIVIPVEDEEAGELPRAYVIKRDAALSEQEVLRYVAERVAPHKKLRGGVIFTESIPKSPSGKLLRRVQIAADREAGKKDGSSVIFS